MGKLLLFLTAAAALAYGVSAVSGPGQHVAAAEGRLHDHADGVLARQVALSGLNVAAHSVRAAYAVASVAEGAYGGPARMEVPHQGGAASVSIEVAADRVTVESVGRHGERAHLVRAVYAVQKTYPPPLFMRQAMLSRDNIEIDHDFTLRSPPGETGSIQTNASLQIGAGTSSINGVGYYGRSAEVKNGQSVTDVFTSDAASALSWRPPVLVPTFLAETHRTKATRQFPGGTALSGNYMLGTRENPAIWYVDGDLRTTGDVTFSGYGVLVVKGKIEVSHHVQTAGAAGESALGLYVNGNIELKKASLQVAGQWLANGKVELDSYTRLTGTMTAQKVELKGPVTIDYVPPTGVLTAPFWTTVPTLSLVRLSRQENASAVLPGD